MKKLPTALLKSILLASLVATASAGPVYDIVGGFSNASNPNGVWKYFQNDTLYDPPSQSTTIFGLSAWYNNGSIPDAITLIQNNTVSTVNGSGTIYIPPGYLNLDPEEFSVFVTFTAASTGTYSIDGNFFGDDSSENSHPVKIVDNATLLYSNTISSFEQKDSFSFSQSLNAGDTLLFEVLTGSAGCSYCDLSTGLQGTITLEGSSGVPEPESWVLVAMGLGALISVRSRFRRPRS